MFLRFVAGDVERTNYMTRIKDNLALATGLVACAGFAILGWTEILMWKPNVMVGIPTPLARLSIALTNLTADPSPGREAFTRQLYMSLWGAHIAIFAIAYWLRLRFTPVRSSVMNTALLVTQVALGLIGDQHLLILVAIELPLILPMGQATKWLCFQIVIASVERIPFLDIGPDAVHLSYSNLMLLEVMTSTMWQIAGFGIGYLIAVESRGRAALVQAHAELASTNSQLLATQMLLSDAVRVSERTRLARDLHDAIGHHLTAQNLHLDLAMRQAGNHENGSLKAARELAQSLLAEIRKLVSINRQDSLINLRAALRTLCSGIPAPRIVLLFDDTLQITNPSIATALFRCVQEAISNTIRHAHASTLHISLAPKDDGIKLSMVDDGQGSGSISSANGLQGMRERIEELDGKFDKGNQSPRGFGIHIWLPEGKQ